MGTVVAQSKYDGLRAQIHKDGEHVTISHAIWKTSPTCSPNSSREPLSKYKRRVPFWMQKRWPTTPSPRNSCLSRNDPQDAKHGIEALAEQLPLKAFVFDILYKDGVSLLDIPLLQRLKILEETMRPSSETSC